MTESTHDDHVLNEHDDGQADTLGQVDPSIQRQPAQWSELWWATVASPTARRCKAHRKTGDRCGKAAMDGQFVCGSHGGRAPQAKRKARERLEEASDRIARSLLKMATDDKVSESVRLSAMRDVLDRAGISAKTAVDVEIALKPWEQISAAAVESLETTSRDAFRRSQGSAGHPPALAVGNAPDLDEIPSGDDEPLIGEVIDADEFAARAAARGRVNVSDHTDTRDGYERARADRAAADMARSGGSTERDRDMSWVAGGAVPSADRLMTVVEGNEYVAELRRAAAERARDEAREAGRAIVHRPQRALPPGRLTR